ncbi:4'-phosphopantetheinyl transferase superfamily protein (plasmid) [Niallia taxi]|uniref:4'-phosphopantetheinyl transferase family protein n=1 Tax=Niallia taxi TaxID=2499688 RepID=UPI0029344546|nr:4'-phosphopantetheinyl transferase superfamily protein [Niallia taxi]WOD65175.1 4'-phosphopantetheinyl transferase superfamily protein [Niallia taxi]
MLEIHAFYIPSQMEQNLYEYLLQFVSNEKKLKIAKYKNKLDSYLTLIGEIMIRLHICKIHEIDNNRIVFQYNKYGKPRVELESPYFFNISHSGNWVVVAYNNSEVGIDIEKIKNLDTELAKNYFTTMEYEHLCSLGSKAAQINCFYDLWTLKESYIKFRGRGLSIPLNSFSIIKYSNSKFFFQLENENSCLEEFYFQQYNLDDNYSFSVCSSDNYFPKEVNVLNSQDLLRLSADLF